MDEQTQLATPIARALDDLHDALMEVQKQGYDVQILIDAIGDLPILAVRLSRDGESVWSAAACSLDDSRGFGRGSQSDF